MMARRDPAECPLEFSESDIAALYDELRRAVRAMRFGRAGTLSGTALAHEALARLLLQARPDAAARQARAPLVFTSKEHLVRAFFQAVRSARIAHHWRNQRHNPVDVLRTNVLLWSVDGAAHVLGAEEAVDADAVGVVHRLLEARREDAHVAARERIARGLELRVLGGLTRAEAAAELEVARSTLDLDLAFFQRWAAVRARHDRQEVTRALARLRDDPHVAEREVMVRALELALFECLPDDRVAARVGRSAADVRRWIAFLRGYLEGSPVPAGGSP